jgi:surface polysaccharide O-acyltransferase-like enzyme
MSRVQSVDAVRALAVLAVIVIHTTPFADPSSPFGSRLDLAVMLNQFSRFAVPYFFVVSGYFWSSKFTGRDQVVMPTVKMLKRVAYIFMAWSVIYLLPTNLSVVLSSGAMGFIKVFYWNILSIIDHPWMFVLQCTKEHLWFLVSLWMCLLISGLMLFMNLNRALMFLAISLYAIGLCGKAYAVTPIGFHVDFNFIYGPFFGLIFFAVGHQMRRWGAKVAWFWPGLMLAVIGYVMQFFELLALNRYWDGRLIQDYVLGTLFIGVGVAMMALSTQHLLRVPFLERVGRLGLGVYASHFVFVDLLSPLDQMYAGSPWWDIFYTVTVFLLAYFTAHLMSKYRYTRRIVM